MADSIAKDIEKGASPVLPSLSSSPSDQAPASADRPLHRRLLSLLLQSIETHGITPTTPSQRTSRSTYQLFFLWFSTNLSVLTISTGISGPAFFSLRLGTSLAVVVCVDVVACAIPAWFMVFGPKLGMRAMVQARYSWGYYLAPIPALLNVFSLQGFLILDTIIGGQTLAAAAPEHLDATLGIVIIAVISLAVTFCGYRFLHWYEQFAWLPNAVAFITLLAVGVRSIHSAPTANTATAADVISFVSIVFISVQSWCTMAPDYGVYHAPVPSWRIFLFTYLGFLLGSLPGHTIGAALAASAPGVPEWAAGLGPDDSDVGGLVGAVLARAGGFGKFLTVLIALTIPSGAAPTMYSFGTSLMAFSPLAARVPRYLWAIVATAVLIPVAITGATRFYNTFVDILSVIGYWSAPFAAIVLADHFVIRKGSWDSYDPEAWDKPRRLPMGFAAGVAFLCAVGGIVPCMSQVYYVGPVAAAGAGDIAVYVGIVIAAVVYIPARMYEMRLEERWGRGSTVVKT